MAITLYHGTARQDWQPHVGACLTDSESAAASYASWRGRDAGSVYLIDLDLGGLVCEDRSHEVDRDAQSWPGDSSASVAALVADGVDVVTYEDEDERGRALTCYRLISDRAISAVRECYEIEI